MAHVTYRELCEQLDASGISGFNACWLVLHDPTFPPQQFQAPFYGWDDAALPAYVAPPVLTLLTPATAPVGTLGFNLHVRGTGLQVGDVVLWNGQPQATDFVSATELVILVDAAWLTAVATIPVSVRAPNGGTSNSLSFTVT